MKSNKKRIFLVFAILTMAIVLSFVFVACDKKKDEPAPPQNTSPSEGLEYSFNKDGSHYGYVVKDIGSCADNNVIIPSEYKSRTVKSIGDNAFKDCISITSITIPDSVTSIGYNAFSGCTKLENIYYTGDIASWCKISGLNNLLTSLRTLYINGNKIEGNLNIPNNVTSIGSYSFSFCGKLTGITIPDSVTSIGKDAFRDCTGLVNITIGDSVSNIDSSAFLNTAWYDNQPDGLVYAGKVAYKYKGTMPENTSISLKRDTISINNSTFVNCNGLKSIMIPDSVTTIGDEAFRGCTSLSIIMIPDSVTNIGNFAFSGCSGLASITGSATNVIAVARQARPTSFVVNITSGNIIENSAFSECSGLTSITIPDSVTSIGYSAFSNCNRLTTITIPDCVTSIGYSAFFGCKELTSVTIGKGITNIGDYAFYNCIGLKDVTFSDSVTSIGKNAFYNCQELTSVTIPDSVTNIGEESFYGCKELKFIAGSVINISVVAKQASPTSFVVNITSGDNISNSTFRGCTELTGISISNSVTSIDEGAFSDCSKLTYINISDSNDDYSSVDGILYNKNKTRIIHVPTAIQGTIIIPDNVTEIGNLFSGRTGLSNITIGNGVTTINERAFVGCTGLKSVKIGNSVTSIGDEAFRSLSRLTSIIIPDNIKHIGNYAFV